MRRIGKIGRRRHRALAIEHDEPERIIAGLRPPPIELGKPLLDAPRTDARRHPTRVQRADEDMPRSFALRRVPSTRHLGRHAEQITQLEVTRIDASISRATRARDSDA